MLNKKQMIVKCLLDNGTSSTTKIASIIKSNNNQTENYLNELLKENKVKKIENDFTNSIYWNLTFKEYPKSKDMFKDIKKEVNKK